MLGAFNHSSNREQRHVTMGCCCEEQGQVLRVAKELGQGIVSAVGVCMYVCVVGRTSCVRIGPRA
jgi:hypothetical protein